MEHIGTKVLETERLILRRFTMEDVQPMFNNWASDPDVTKYLTWPAHGSAEITGMILRDWVSGYEREDQYRWAIVLKENGPEPIGDISAHGIRENTLCATMGYCMSRAHWGKGIMTEALKAVIDFFFDEVGFNRVAADHDIENPASGRVMEKAGMRFEGTARQGGRNNRGIVDICHWAILKEDR